MLIECADLLQRTIAASGRQTDFLWVYRHCTCTQRVLYHLSLPVTAGLVEPASGGDHSSEHLGSRQALKEQTHVSPRLPESHPAADSVVKTAQEVPWNISARCMLCGKLAFKPVIRNSAST